MAKRKASRARKASSKARAASKPSRSPTNSRRASSSRKQSKAAGERVLRNGPIRRRNVPEQGALPEMENMGADRKMDDICRRIANRHAEINDLRHDDAADYDLALSRLRKIERMSYNRHGVEMVRVPGEEKLRVRTSGTGQATAEVDEPADEDVDAMDAETGDDVDDVDNDDQDTEGQGAAE